MIENIPAFYERLKAVQMQLDKVSKRVDDTSIDNVKEDNTVFEWN